MKRSYLDKVILKEFGIGMASAFTMMFLLTTSVSSKGVMLGKMLLKLFVIYTMYLSVKLFAKAFKKNVVMTLKIWRGFGPVVFLKALAVLVLTLAAMFLLNQVPFLNYGWTDLFMEKSGNIFIGPMLDQGGGTYPLVYALVYFVVLLLLVPDFVHFEEKIFRKGKLGFSQRLKGSFLFGLVHCLVGVSLSTGLALALPGYYFSVVYKKAYERQLHGSPEKKENKKKYHINATVESATHHAMYNTIIIVLVIGYLSVLILNI